MALMNAKRWVVAAVLGCGLAVGAGGVMTANGQDKKPDPKPMPTADEQLNRLKAEAALKAIDAAKAKDALEKAQADAAQAAAALKKLQADEEGLKNQKEEKLKYDRLFRAKEAEKAAGPEFKYVPQEVGAKPMTVKEFEKAVKDGEADGSTFVGLMNLGWSAGNSDRTPLPTLVFRRTAAPSAANVSGGANPLALLKRFGAADAAALTPPPTARNAPADPQAAIQAEIDKLTKQLADLKAKEGGKTEVRFELSKVGGDYDAGQKLLFSLVRAKFGQKVVEGLTLDQGKDTLYLRGLTKEQATWLADTVNGLTAPKPMPK